MPNFISEDQIEKAAVDLLTGLGFNGRRRHWAPTIPSGQKYRLCSL